MNLAFLNPQTCTVACTDIQQWMPVPATDINKLCDVCTTSYFTLNQARYVTFDNVKPYSCLRMLPITISKHDVICQHTRFQNYQVLHDCQFRLTKLLDVMTEKTVSPFMKYVRFYNQLSRASIIAIQVYINDEATKTNAYYRKDIFKVKV